MINNYFVADCRIERLLSPVLSPPCPLCGSLSACGGKDTPIEILHNMLLAYFQPLTSGGVLMRLCAPLGDF